MCQESAGTKREASPSVVVARRTAISIAGHATITPRWAPSLCGHIAGLARHPHDAWIQQIARNLTDRVDGFLRGKRYLIHDRDPLFAAAFRAILHAAGVTCLELPPRSPNLNAVAERFVLSLKSECLAKLVPLGERHLRFAISEFVEHYHLERNHQASTTD